MVNLNLTTICSCLPGLQAFVCHVLPHVKARHEERKRSEPRRDERSPIAPRWLCERLQFLRRSLHCPDQLPDMLHSKSIDPMSTENSGTCIISNQRTPMRSQNETDWTATLDTLEDPTQSLARSVHQQATRDYHSHLGQNWWDRA